MYISRANVDQDILDYFLFWVLTWWVWASTVAYNVRFRQADWFHIIAAILQLFVFGALAAFTRDFNIFTGLGFKEGPEWIRADQIQIDLGAASKEGLMVEDLQEDPLSVLNFRGIAMTMACSRILLMAQYTIGIYAHTTSFLLNRSSQFSLHPRPPSAPGP
jgi:hypothetical protein